MTHTARTALLIWLAITLLVAASLVVIGFRLGPAGFGSFIQQPPLTNLPVTLASVALLWLSVGALLYLIASGRLHQANIFSVGGFFIVGWLYLNILSERFRYGDYQYYLDAATKLYGHQALPPTYYYPPLWATLTQFLVPLGEDGFFLILWILNFLALLVFYVLLHRVLQQYGFTPGLAALTTTLFMAVNTPLLRTLFYVQVNLHTINLILLSLLLYPRRPFFSALALALAVHLKASPAVLVLPFLLEKDWRWTGWFVLCALALAGVTVAINGFGPFFDVWHNIQSLALSQNTIFHDSSFDSLLRFAGHLLNINLAFTRVITYIAKALLLAAAAVVMLRSARRMSFRNLAGRGRLVWNAMPPFLILMTLAAPVVWEHHGIFVGLAFLLLLKRLDAPSEWFWFAFAYLLEFLLPTFDFFPWSFGRLLAPLIVLWLMWKTAERSEASSSFDELNLLPTAFIKK